MVRAATRRLRTVRQAHVRHQRRCVPLDPAGLPARLDRAGFTAVRVDHNEFAVRFRAEVSPGPA